MTTQERNFLDRAGNLARRNFTIAMNLESHQGTHFGEILQEIYNENQAEHDRLQKLCNTKHEYLSQLEDE